jgi:hypothetical protein
MESPLNTILNKCKSLMPAQGADYYGDLEDLLMAMNEMAIMYDDAYSRKEYGSATWPMQRFMKLRDQFIKLRKEI